MCLIKISQENQSSALNRSTKPIYQIINQELTSARETLYARSNSSLSLVQEQNMYFYNRVELSLKR